jgi:hypothetical protein
VPVSVPVPDIPRKEVVWRTTMAEVRWNAKLSGTTIAQSGLNGVEGVKIHEDGMETDAPSATLMNEPDRTSTLAGSSQDCIPVASRISVVTMPDAFWSMTPPPGPDEVLIAPINAAALAEEPSARAANTDARMDV